MKCKEPEEDVCNITQITTAFPHCECWWSFEPDKKCCWCGKG